ncbi:putative leader peptide [Rhodococcus sp. (in: high G+C Gram-positive bacteria)]
MGAGATAGIDGRQHMNHLALCAWRRRHIDLCRTTSSCC